MNGLNFAAPYALWALPALPALWWLLRLTPPQPQAELFPPLRLLQSVPIRETEAAQSPWWLTALRLLLAALLILAFARPQQNRPAAFAPAAGQAAVILVDNSWAAAKHRQPIIAEARLLIAAAEAAGSPIYILPTVTGAAAKVGPYSGAEARRAIDRLDFTALPPDRPKAFGRLAAIAAQSGGKSGLSAAYLTDGMASPADKSAFAALQSLPIAAMQWYLPQNTDFIGITAAENGADGLHFTLTRTIGQTEQAWSGRIKAYDEKMHVLGEQIFRFAGKAHETRGLFALPPAIRNDIAMLKVENAEDSAGRPINTANAAGLRLLDSSHKQKIAAVLAPQQSQMTQPLLSPLYYVVKALEGAPQLAGGKALQADSGTNEENISRLLAARPSLLIIGDMAIIPPQAQRKLRQWVAQGGTLLRFAGPALANAESGGAAAETAAQSLLPVRLRRGERSFGGALSWEKPQHLAPFAPQSPFYGMAVPQDVTVSRQILAEPSADLPDKSWISLTDGTPLMTAAELGKGRLVFVHAGLETDWSNLALSGFFVEMLRRLAALSGGDSAMQPAAPQTKFAPYRIIGANGAPENAGDTIRPLVLQRGQAPKPDFYTPPGLYGSHNSQFPLNLLGAADRLARLLPPALQNQRAETYSKGENPWQSRLWLAAVWLFIADIFISLLLKSGFRAGGRLFSFRSRNIWDRSAFWRKGGRLLLFCAALALIPAFIGHAAAAKTAQTAPKPAAENMAAQAAKTRLAYVLTGNAALDALSKAGLENLSRFIGRRTTIDPGEAAGINPAADELAFYPLIYWPIDAAAPMPPQAAVNAIDAYMRRGGTVLFDTRDALQSGLQLDKAAASPNAERLRALLAGLNVPPLIPAPKEHVVARSFYIMPDFPGRYRASPLWIAAGADAPDKNDAGAPNKSLIRAGDGVSPILITANDFAAAWADNGHGSFLFLPVPDGEEQRLWAFRGGLNIVMYVLTGNYKADQMHAPELLRRLSP